MFLSSIKAVPVADAHHCEVDTTAPPPTLRSSSSGDIPLDERGVPSPHRTARESSRPPSSSIPYSEWSSTMRRTAAQGAASSALPAPPVRFSGSNSEMRCPVMREEELPPGRGPVQCSTATSNASDEGERGAVCWRVPPTDTCGEYSTFRSLNPADERVYNTALVAFVPDRLRWWRVQRLAEWEWLATHTAATTASETTAGPDCTVFRANTKAALRSRGGLSEGSAASAALPRRRRARQRAKSLPLLLHCDGHRSGFHHSTCHDDTSSTGGGGDVVMGASAGRTLPPPTTCWGAENIRHTNNMHTNHHLSTSPGPNPLFSRPSSTSLPCSPNAGHPAHGKFPFRGFGPPIGPSHQVSLFHHPTCLAVFQRGIRSEAKYRLCEQASHPSTAPSRARHPSHPHKPSRCSVSPRIASPTTSVASANVVMQLPRMVGTTSQLKDHPSMFDLGMTTLLSFESFFYREQLRQLSHTPLQSSHHTTPRSDLHNCHSVLGSPCATRPTGCDGVTERMIPMGGPLRRVPSRNPSPNDGAGSDDASPLPPPRSWTTAEGFSRQIAPDDACPPPRRAVSVPPLPMPYRDVFRRRALLQRRARERAQCGKERQPVARQPNLEEQRRSLSFPTSPLVGVTETTLQDGKSRSPLNTTRNRLISAAPKSVFVAPPTSSHHRCVRIKSLQDAFIFHPLLDRVGAGAYSKVYAALPIFCGRRVCAEGAVIQSRNVGLAQAFAECRKPLRRGMERGHVSRVDEAEDGDEDPRISWRGVPVALKVIPRSVALEVAQAAAEAQEQRRLAQQKIKKQQQQQQQQQLLLAEEEPVSTVQERKDEGQEVEEELGDTVLRRRRLQLQEVEREIKLLRQLRHSGCARYLGAFRTPNEYAIAMELPSMAINVRQYLQQYGVPSEARTALIVYQLIAALAYLHEEFGVLHRDIKLENVVISRIGEEEEVCESTSAPPHRRVTARRIGKVLQEWTAAQEKAYLVQGQKTKLDSAKSPTDLQLDQVGTGVLSGKETPPVGDTPLRTRQSFSSFSMNRTEASPHCMLRATLIDFGLARRTPLPPRVPSPSTTAVGTHSSSPWSRSSPKTLACKGGEPPPLLPSSARVSPSSVEGGGLRRTAEHLLGPPSAALTGGLAYYAQQLPYQYPSFTMRNLAITGMSSAIPLPAQNSSTSPTTERKTVLPPPVLDSATMPHLTVRGILRTSNTRNNTTSTTTIPSHTTTFQDDTPTTVASSNPNTLRFSTWSIPSPGIELVRHYSPLAKSNATTTALGVSEACATWSTGATLITDTGILGHSPGLPYGSVRPQTPSALTALHSPATSISHFLSSTQGGAVEAFLTSGIQKDSGILSMGFLSSLEGRGAERRRQPRQQLFTNNSLYSLSMAYDEEDIDSVNDEMRDGDSTYGGNEWRSIGATLDISQRPSFFLEPSPSRSGGAGLLRDIFLPDLVDAETESHTSSGVLMRGKGDTRDEDGADAAVEWDGALSTDLSGSEPTTDDEEEDESDGGGAGHASPDRRVSLHRSHTAAPPQDPCGSYASHTSLANTHAPQVPGTSFGTRAGSLQSRAMSERDQTSAASGFPAGGRPAAPCFLSPAWTSRSATVEEPYRGSLHQSAAVEDAEEVEGVSGLRSSSHHLPFKSTAAHGTLGFQTDTPTQRHDSHPGQVLVARPSQRSSTSGSSHLHSGSASPLSPCTALFGGSDGGGTSAQVEAPHRTTPALPVVNTARTRSTSTSSAVRESSTTFPALPNPSMPMLLLTPCGTERYLPPEMLKWMLQHVFGGGREEEPEALPHKTEEREEASKEQPPQKRLVPLREAHQLDLYATGIVAHVLLSGFFPFNASSRAGQLLQQQQGPRCTSEHWKGVSAEAIDFVKQLLHPDPCHRMPSAVAALHHPFLRQAAEHARRLGLRPHVDGMEVPDLPPTEDEEEMVIEQDEDDEGIKDQWQIHFKSTNHRADRRSTKQPILPNKEACLTVKEPSSTESSFVGSRNDETWNALMEELQPPPTAPILTTWLPPPLPSHIKSSLTNSNWKRDIPSTTLPAPPTRSYAPMRWSPHPDALSTLSMFTSTPFSATTITDYTEKKKRQQEERDAAPRASDRREEIPRSPSTGAAVPVAVAVPSAEGGRGVAECIAGASGGADRETRIPLDGSRKGVSTSVTESKPLQPRRVGVPSEADEPEEEEEEDDMFRQLYAKMVT